MEGIQIFDDLVGFKSDIVYMKVNGYVDTSTSLELVNKLKSLLKQNTPQFVLDLSGVNYVSSAGWGVFVGEIKDVREKGGDIKLVNMTPEVYDVFEMLEFNRILRSYDSVEEAINEFDLIRGFDLTQSPGKELNQKTAPPPPAPEIQVSRASAEKTISSDPTHRFWAKRSVDPKVLSVPDKIKHIATVKPMLNMWGIRKELATEAYGEVSINPWRLYFHLRELNLNTREKRHRYYRSR